MNLDNIIKEIETGLEKAIAEVSEKAVDIMKQEVPVDTGNLRDSVNAVKTGKLSYEIGHDPAKTTKDDYDYARGVYFGTRAHLITPRKPGGVLVFDVGGKTIFTKRANHPGTKANKYLDRTLDRLQSYVSNSVKINL